MPPLIASVIFAIGFGVLFFFDRDKGNRVSKSLWIPTAWLFFCLSRSVSEWLGMSPPADLAITYVEGSPVDAAVLEAIEVLALIVVFNRRERVGPILRNNWATCLFFFYAALSISWSDFPFVTLKHWVKGIGDVMMVLIVLTEPSVADAIRRLVTRLGFVLLPLSVLFIKYYPLLGRRLTLSWTMESIGVTTQKNGLGELCDFLGLVLIWRLRTAYNNREDPNRRRRLAALGAVLAMVVWLLWSCNSMTSTCALSMASVVMLLSTKSAFRNRPARVHLLIVALLAITIYALFFQSSGSMIESLGKDPTLTGRTDIWNAVLSIPNNRVVGVGYETFWLGSRLKILGDTFPNFHLQESHNGYIEFFLNLGWIGLTLLGILIATGYLSVIRTYRRDPDFGSLKIAILFASIITGLTEAAFRMMGPPWIFLLLVTIAVPAYAERKVGGRRARQLSRLPQRLAVTVPEEALTGF